MGLSQRILLLDDEDLLYRLPSSTFSRMLSNPESVRIERFAGARVRMADVIVELVERRPVQIAWITYGILGFDREGCFDLKAYIRCQRALAELAFAPVFPSSTCAVQSRRFSSGCESRPAPFAPAGSNRSSHGGNEMAEAFGVEGH